MQQVGYPLLIESLLQSDEDAIKNYLIESLSEPRLAFVLGPFGNEHNLLERVEAEIKNLQKITKKEWKELVQRRYEQTKAKCFHEISTLRQNNKKLRAALKTLIGFKPKSNRQEQALSLLVEPVSEALNAGNARIKYLQDYLDDLEIEDIDACKDRMLKELRIKRSNLEALVSFRHESISDKNELMEYFLTLDVE